MLLRFWLLPLLISTLNAADWIRAGVNTNQLIWGIKGGVQFAIHPAGFRDIEGGPRGLIRLGYPVLTNGGYDLVNFIAIEPVVKGRKGFSELELSALDGRQGKRLWVDAPANVTSLNSVSPNKATETEQLELKLKVEKFENGAHVYLKITQRSDAPDEIRFSVHTEPDSATLDYCILTATMGNMIRTRQLWLRDETVTSLTLYPDYKETKFARHTIYPLNRFHITEGGQVMVAITTDEDDPAKRQPFPNPNFWFYQGAKVTQYWKKIEKTYRGDLHVAVNARYTYWGSTQPIPGGIAFENFELRERFFEGQQFVFGITGKTPAQLGFARD